MRHKVAGKQLCLKEDHRRAMIRNLAAGLFEHGQIETTLPKARMVQPFVEKLITTAKQKSLQTRRQLTARLPDRKVFAWIADPNVPESRKTSEFWELPPQDAIEFNRFGEVRKAPRLIEHILTRVAPRYKDRAGGYTRIIKLDKHRVGDASNLVVLQLVGSESGSQVSGKAGHRRKSSNRRSAFAAKKRKEIAESKAATKTKE
jgi:large subunit ribosomal protein L17